MEFKFIGNPTDLTDNRGEVTYRGIRFPLNVPVKVDDAAAIQKLMANHHFAVVGADGKTHVQVPTEVKGLIVPKSELVVDAAVKPKRGRKPVSVSANA